MIANVLLRYGSLVVCVLSFCFVFFVCDCVITTASSQLFVHRGNSKRIRGISKEIDEGKVESCEVRCHWVVESQ